MLSTRDWVLSADLDLAWRGQGRKLGPRRLVVVDPEVAAAGLSDPSTSARQASMRAMI
ncbi:MAG TPA: hypothetical protein VFZ97_04230 [Acidimicrobiales bacterium]